MYQKFLLLLAFAGFYSSYSIAGTNERYDALKTCAYGMGRTAPVISDFVQEDAEPYVLNREITLEAYFLSRDQDPLGRIQRSLGSWFRTREGANRVLRADLSPAYDRVIGDFLMSGTETALPFSSNHPLMKDLRQFRLSAEFKELARKYASNLESCRDLNVMELTALSREILAVFPASVKATGETSQSR